MADDLTTILRFVGDPANAEAAINGLISSLQNAAKQSASFSDKAASGGEKTTAAYTQLQQVTTGLSSTIASLNINVIQLVTALSSSAGASNKIAAANANITTSAQKAEGAMLQEAQAVARLQQISGNTPAAIKTLGDALAKVTDRSSLPALRAELQKTYLDTNYANSPLIGAIRQINTGNQLANASLGQFTQGLKQFLTAASQAGTATGSIEATVAGLASAAGALAVGTIVALGAGIAALAQHAADADEKIFDLTQKTGFAAQSLAAMKLAADTSGVSIEEVSSFIVKFEKNLGEAAAGNKELAATFQQLGIDAQKGLRDPQVAFDQFLKKFNSLQDDAAKIDLVQKLGGRGGAELNQFLKEGANGIDGFIQKAKELGVVLPSALDAANADRFNDSITNIENQASGLLTTIGRQLLPVIQPLLDSISQTLANAGPNAESFGQSLASGLQQSLLVGGDLLSLVDDIHQGLIGLFSVLEDGSDTTKNAAAEIDSSLGLLREFIFFIRGGILLIEDVVRLTADVVIGAIKSIALALLSVPQGFLSLFGIVNDTIESEVKRLSADIAALNADFDKGLQKTRQIGEQIKAAEGQAKALAGGFAETEFGPDGRIRPKGTANVSPFTAAPRATEQFTPIRRGGGKSSAGSELADQKALGELKLKQLQLEEKQAELGNKRISEGLKTAFQDRLISLNTFTQLSIQNDQELLQKRLASIAEEKRVAEANASNEEATIRRTVKNRTDAANKIELAEAKKNQKIGELQLKADQLQQNFDIEAERKRDEQRRTEEKAAIDHENRLADIREASRKRSEATIKDAAGLGVIGAVAAEQQLAEIEKQRLDEREALLQRDLRNARENETERARIADELIKLESDRATASEDAARRIRDASTRELNDRIAFLRNLTGAYENVKKAELDAAAAQLGAQRQRNQITENTFQRNISAIKIQQIESESAAREKQINEEFARLTLEAQKAQQSKERLLEIEKLGNAALKAERDRAQAEKDAEREAQRQRELQANPASPLSIFGPAGQQAADQGANLFGQFASTATSALSQVSASLGNVQSIFEGAFSSIASGLGSIIESFILTGKTGPAAFKKLAAGVIASIAAQSAVKAIFELAEGLAAAASFPLNPLGLQQAALHYAAAQTFGILAGGAALVGAALGATSGGSGGGSQFRTQDEQRPDSRTVEQGGKLPGQQPVHVIIRASVAPGAILDVVHQDIKDNGQTRQLIKQNSGG